MCRNEIQVPRNSGVTKGWCLVFHTQNVTILSQENWAFPCKKKEEVCPTKTEYVDLFGSNTLVKIYIYFSGGEADVYGNSSWNSMSAARVTRQDGLRAYSSTNIAFFLDRQNYMIEKERIFNDNQGYYVELRNLLWLSFCFLEKLNDIKQDVYSFDGLFK
ncbi:hypothetical protein PHYBLDRAFT_69253 [Phycomyces blakesleeanus NRRL 1555(-)]|uniref:Uncharacterized protein n=1 Tax=Phycomyces blakesleeanus (strain ATCC 8743b / DSM 1359 / FGSC 10004 / NBRC 33097 / NRRL 1555) TaxID=763407 RepID=A0A162ZP62_PHYB8|nr:hypothetical protein PHYBLDRAFT_69253 [Phycomyces blakesleeanus NRRL 1555(-)]OAD68181.1 hypothetical protein PHYBLDRAFT_69253 [Phycomyces blakesleeanus NRRL 1555(-)]|eukprot:XP_018286221.1 hypothetical protein PHYBLDRAFT_69253 [Phycomyces blakesleeanus NRRL 1555(-)]